MYSYVPKEGIFEYCTVSAIVADIGPDVKTGAPRQIL